ncbi:MAG: hypothetical protein MJZ53_05660 [Paludibacteraceae bacterium]|nr:hypothetical protein [Paludibacteraceae bacterium]
MRKELLLSLLLILVGCCKQSQEPELPTEGTVVATVVSYHEATLSGDVSPSMHVTMENSTKSSNRVGEGHTLTLTLSGVPAGWLANVTAWVHSNKASGAGEITVCTSSQEILSRVGTFKEWTGSYSPLSVAVVADQLPIPYDGSDIVLTIVGTTNSLYLDRLEVTYSKDKPILPPTQDTVPEQDTIPQPAKYVITADTNCVSGEYAIGRVEKVSFVLSGCVINKEIAYTTTRISKDTMTGLWQWHTDTILPSMRYRLQFDSDSVAIQYVETGKGIGYNAVSLSNNDRRWAWRKANDGTLFLHHNMRPHEKDSTEEAYVLGIGIEELTIEQNIRTWYDTSSYWILFPISL